MTDWIMILIIVGLGFIFSLLTYCGVLIYKEQKKINTKLELELKDE